MKPSWTPISASGFHSLSQAELAAYFVDDFEPRHQAERRRLVGRLLAYLNALAALGLPLEIWLDGSFTTRCPEPADIDLVVLLSPQDTNRLTRAEQVQLDLLLNERDLVRIRYDCDVYHLDPYDSGQRAYWTQQFARNHDGTPKGIFTLILLPLSA